jgi:signal transduction histidine kinase
LIIEVLLLYEDTLARSGIAVHQYLEEDMPLVLGDKKRLEEVFIHLFSNAVNAMPEGGHLRIITSHMPDPPPSRLRIEIADSGVGIPGDVLDKIFEPFFTTKTISSGLGLTVSREILKRHNGTIKILSEAGKGTTVIIEIIL